MAVRPTNRGIPQTSESLVPSENGPILPDHSFALCLTHDVDRIIKNYQALYYAVREGSPSHLFDVLPSRNPYWQFDEIAALEADLGVRSAFYLLNEPPIYAQNPRSWVHPGNWIRHLGRYDICDSDLVSTMRELMADGWEIGLHGSYRSHDDRDRLRDEKEMLEDCLNAPVVGGRQHYLKLSIPETWRYYSDIGLRYDATLGSTQSYGFQYGYRPLRPFGDDFVVFPLTIMDQTLPSPTSDFDDAWRECETVLEEAAENGAVMTVLWHPRLFAESDFPGYRELYRRLVQRALDMNAWVGSPAACYRKLDLDRVCTEGYDRLSSNETDNPRSQRLSDVPIS